MRPVSGAAIGYSSWPPLQVEAAFPFRLAMPGGLAALQRGATARDAGSTAAIFHGGHDEILSTAASILLWRGFACQEHARVHCRSRGADQGPQEHRRDA